MPDKLNKLAEEEREKKPFSKIDKMEKDLNLDQEPDTDIKKEDESPKDKSNPLLDERSIIELSATQRAQFNNQAPL